MENNFTQGGPRKMTAEEYKELTREKSAPPPSPVGIGVEALAEDYLKKVGTHDRPDITKHDFIQGFKAGYSASLPQSSTEEEKERKVILLASYCGDNPNCTDDLPCEDCLKMCNVAIIKDSDIKKVIAGYDFMRDNASLPVTGESEAIGERKFSVDQVLDIYRDAWIDRDNYKNRFLRDDIRQYFKSKFDIDV